MTTTELTQQVKDKADQIQRQNKNIKNHSKQQTNK